MDFSHLWIWSEPFVPNKSLGQIAKQKNKHQDRLIMSRLIRIFTVNEIIAFGLQG